MKTARRFPSKDSEKPMVWTAKVCPFAERVAIGLHELSIDFDPVEVDLANKPASLFEINPKGLVPAMKDQNKHINDSYIILQYMDEMWSKEGHDGLLPKSPADRAVARTWCEFINTQIVRPFYEVLMKESDDEREAAKEKLLNALKTIDEAMRNVSDGPFFFGTSFGIVDIMLAPHTERFSALKHFRNFEVPDSEEFKRFHLWWQAVQKHPSFQPARVTTEFIVGVYQKYFSNLAASRVAESIRKGEPLT